MNIKRKKLQDGTMGHTENRLETKGFYLEELSATKIT